MNWPPDGSYWYRTQRRSTVNGEVTWEPWEIVHLVTNPNPKTRGGQRSMIGRFWKEKLNRLDKLHLIHHGGLLREMIPIPGPETCQALLELKGAQRGNG